MNILQEIYTDNKVHVKLPQGLIEPFITQSGVKQGCVLSPILFNLFLNKVPKLFNNECDPVHINSKPMNVLMWADDLVLVSKTTSGMRECLSHMSNHFDNLGLSINTSKTKIMILNSRGLKLDTNPDHSFFIGGNRLEVVDEYKYLGFIIKPSGTFSVGTDNLMYKASRAWFSISNLIFRNKKMHFNRALQIFHSLITPVALYACEYWLPSIFSTKKFCVITYTF